MQTRAGISVPKQNFNLSAVATISSFPHTYHQALKDPNCHNAMNDEYDAFMKNNTWCLVPKPVGANVVSGKWIYTYKYGMLSHYKPRWVVHGFS
jgi:hypothetical protein